MSITGFREWAQANGYDKNDPKVQDRFDAMYASGGFSGVTAPPEADTAKDELRAAFEALSRTSKTPLTRSRKGNYVWQPHASAWKWFQAGVEFARNASPAPQPDCKDCPTPAACGVHSECLSDAPQAPEGEKIARLYHDAWGNTYVHWLGKPDAEFADFVYTHPAKPGGDADMRAICEALGFDPTNHHNAAKCPYCRPAGGDAVKEALTDEQIIAGAVAGDWGHASFRAGVKFSESIQLRGIGTEGGQPS